MKNNRAFTLMEMLTVVLIVGILTAVAVPQYNRAIKKSRATEAIAMLRMIHDSGERLAAEFGYKSFQAFSAGNAAKATFQRMDMFNQDTIPCAFTATQMTCEHYTYYLNQGKDYITAAQNGDSNETQIYLRREDLPTVTCYSKDADVCDIYNLEFESKKGS